MKISLSFFVILLFSVSLHSFEVKITQSRVTEPLIDFKLQNTSDDQASLPPVPKILDKVYISYKCEAEISAMKISKDRNGHIVFYEKDTIKIKKDLGRLQPNEEWFKNANMGEIDFSFKIKDKTLNFDLSLQGPELAHDGPTSNDLVMSLAFHKTYSGEGKNRRPASKETSEISLDSDKALPGGFHLRVNIGDSFIKGYSTNAKVHCTEPKKDNRQVEIFIF